MPLFIRHLLFSLFAYLILGVAYYGWGSLGARLFKISDTGSEKSFALILLGWAMILAFLQAWHLFMPVSPGLALTLACLGLVFALSDATRVASQLKNAARSTVFAKVGLILITGTFVAVCAMQPVRCYDSGLYHFNSIRWANEYPIIPGLGNLHGRLAFNQSFFLYVALLNLSPVFNHGHSLANSLLLLIVLLEGLFSLTKSTKLIRQKALISVPQFLPVLFLPVLMLIGIRSGLNLPSPTPDIASTLLQIVLFWHFCRLLQNGISEDEATSTVRLILIFSAITATIKLSNFVYVVGTATLALVLLLHHLSCRFRIFMKEVHIVLYFVMVVAIVWTFRGIISSGCPAFPSAFMCVDLDWAMPAKVIRNEANWVMSWARQPGVHWSKVLGGWDWFMPWLKRVAASNVTVTYPVVSSLIGLTAGVIVAVPWRKRLNLEDIKPFFAPIPAIGALMFWFYTAPDPRFAEGLFWILPVASVVPLLLKATDIKSSVCRIGFYLFTFLLINLVTISWLIQNAHLFARISNAGYQPLPASNLKERMTESGLKIKVPIAGDQCWDSPIPCTPYFNDQLRLRGSDYSSGFSVQQK